MSAWRGHYLVAVDGTGTFSSQRVHGPCCLWARHRNGSSTYSHQQLCAVMVHPDQRQVLPMAIEAVRNGDGSTKNDCERGAWARLVPVLASLDRRMQLIVMADGLFSQGPQIRLLQEHGLRFLLVARAGDHPHLQAQLDRSDAPWFADPSPEGQERDRQLRVVPEAELNAANPDLKVQVLQSSERRGSGEDARRAFTWVTDLPLNPHNASELARAARSRWKIENETFNTLKNGSVPGTQLRTRNPAPVGYFRCADAAGVPDRPAAGNGLPRHAANLRQVLYPNRDVGTSAQQFLCGSLPQLAGTVRPRPRDLHRVPRLRYVLTTDRLSSCSMKKGSGCPSMPRGPMPP